MDILEGHSDPIHFILEKDPIILPNIGECVVELFTEAKCKIPHFHLYNKDHSFGTALRIYTADYYPHDGENAEHLTKDQIIILDQWMNSLSSTKISNHWSSLCMLYGFLNSDFEPFDETYNGYPNYLKLSDLN